MKEIRNEVFHSADFKLSDTELDDYIKDMTTLLQDPTLLLTDPKAISAVTQLNEVTPGHCRPHTSTASRCLATNCLIKLLLFSSCCPCHQGEVNCGYCHLFFVFSVLPLLTFLSLRSLSTVSKSFYPLLLFSSLLPLSCLS